MKYITFILLNIVVNSVNAKDLEMIILHNGDVHGRFEQTKESLGDKYVGGFARTAHVIEETRNRMKSGEGPSVLFLNTGGTFTGSPLFTVYRWKIAVDFLNALRPDAVCLGSHEFDDGISSLNKFAEAANFPLLAANLRFVNEHVLTQYIKPYTILNVQGRKIGIIGYLSTKTKILANFVDVIFEDEVIALRRECEKLKKEDVKIIIALGHSGYKTDLHIAKEVEDIDLIVGGHSHTLLWNGEPPDEEIPLAGYPKIVVQANNKAVPVVHAYAYTKYLGNLYVVFDEDGNLKTYHGQPIYLDAKIPQDHNLLSLLETFRPKVATRFLEVIGKSRSYINGDTCRKNECSFGNTLTDSFIDYVAFFDKGPYWSNTPIAIVNAGSIRSSIDASEQEVTSGDIFRALPFKQHLRTFDLLGEDLIKSLELGARYNGEEKRGGFLQVSGLKVVYNFSRPVGSRVTSVKARCGECDVPTFSPVLHDKLYKIVSTKFLLNGGDGHIILKDKARNIIHYEIPDADVLKRYFRLYRILTPQEDERIIVLDSSSNKETMKRDENGCLTKSTSTSIFIFIVIVQVLYS